MMFNERQPITTLAEVRAFASYLFFDLETSFHPDDDFTEYVRRSDNSPAFTPIRAERLNQRMSECHDVCAAAGADIYERMGIATEYFNAIASGVNPDVARNALYFASDSR